MSSRRCWAGRTAPARVRIPDPPRLTPTAFGLPDPLNPVAIDSVTITVRCSLDLSDLAALPLRTVTIERTFTSPLDRYRGYQ